MSTDAFSNKGADSPARRFDHATDQDKYLLAGTEYQGDLDLLHIRPSSSDVGAYTSRICDRVAERLTFLYRSRALEKHRADCYIEIDRITRRLRRGSLTR